MANEFYPIKKISVTVPTAASTTNVTLNATAPFISTSAEGEFVLLIGSVNNLVQDSTATVSVNDTVSTLPLEDERGYNVRADRIVKRAEHTPGGVTDNPIVGIKCAIATDPARIVVLTPLRRSGFTGQANTAGSATGTGINNPAATA